MTKIPWVGLLALIAMFVIPHLPDRLFEGPRTVKHWPRRHVCGVCGAPWADGHACAPAPVPAAAPAAATAAAAATATATGEVEAPLHGELRRLEPPGSTLDRLAS
jgi:hypothetical protein